MTHRQPKSPGSFQDELGVVIERVAPADRKRAAKPEKPKEREALGDVHLNDRLFERAWRKSD